MWVCVGEREGGSGVSCGPLTPYIDLVTSPHVTLGGVDQFRVHETDWVGPHVEQT